MDPALVGVKVQLLFDPFDLSQIEVRYQNRPMGQAVLRRLGRHTHPAVKPLAPPPKASGIDHLGLVRDRLAQEQQQRLGRISHRKVAATDEEAANSPEEDPQ